MIDTALGLVSLDKVRPFEMQELLADERAAWQRELAWDYTATSALIARSIASRAFAGFALRTSCRVAAYCYFLESRQRSLLGAVHALPEAEAERGAARLVERSLAHLLDTLRARRLETQLLYFGGEDLHGVFTRRGALPFPRQFLSTPLDPLLERLEGSKPQASACLRPFRDSHLAIAANLVYESFVGSADARMSECYRSLRGATAFVEGVVSRGGCGRFAPHGSFLYVERDVPLGVILVTEISPGVGHVVQISVAPSAQGAGLGTRLLAHAAARLGRLGYRELSLSVTLANTRAHAWYRSLGFQLRKEFSAYAWERDPVAHQ